MHKQRFTVRDKILKLSFSTFEGVGLSRTLSFSRGSNVVMIRRKIVLFEITTVGLRTKLISSKSSYLLIYLFIDLSVNLCTHLSSNFCISISQSRCICISQCVRLLYLILSSPLHQKSIPLKFFFLFLFSASTKDIRPSEERERRARR